MSALRGRLALTALLLAVLSAPTPGACVQAVLHSSEVPAPDVLVAVLGLIVHTLAAWLLVVVALVLGSRAPARAGHACARLLRCSAPAHLRQAMTVALGTGLVLALPAPAVAATGPASARAIPAASFDWPGLHAPAPEPAAPEPPVSEVARPATTGRGAPDARVRDAVVVRPGDTLWELAARSLPEPVAHADRAAEWPRWWAANRDVVGDDPDLLLPGQRLVAPPPR